MFSIAYYISVGVKYRRQSNWKQGCTVSLYRRYNETRDAAGFKPTITKFNTICLCVHIVSKFESCYYLKNFQIFSNNKVFASLEYDYFHTKFNIIISLTQHFWSVSEEVKAKTYGRLAFLTVWRIDVDSRGEVNHICLLFRVSLC